MPSILLHDFADESDQSIQKLEKILFKVSKDKQYPRFPTRNDHLEPSSPSSTAHITLDFLQNKALSPHLPRYLHLEDESEEAKKIKKPMRVKAHYDMTFEEEQMSIYERSKLRESIKHTKLSAMEEKLMKEKYVEVTGKPSINPRSKVLKRSIKDVFQWYNDRKGRIKEKQTRKELKTRSLLRDCPPILHKSVKIVEEKRMLQFEQGEKIESVDNRLYNEAKIKSLNREMKTIEANEKFPFRPKICPHSTNIQREMPVHDRLYSLAKEKQQRQNSLHLQQDHQLWMERKLYSTARGTSCSDIQVVDRLVAKGEEYRQRRIQLRDQEEKAEDRLRNQSKVLKRSEYLSQSMDRSKWMENGKRRRGRTTTVPPSKETHTIVGSQSSPIDPKRARTIYEKQLEWKKGISERVMRKKEEIDGGVIKDCTFSWRTLDDSCPSRTMLSSEEENRALFDREKERCIEQRARLERAREQTLEESLAECSFAPNLYKSGMFVRKEERCRTEEDRPPPVQVSISLASDHQVVPSGWKEYSTEDGFLYYLNTITQATQWEFPRV